MQNTIFDICPWVIETSAKLGAQDCKVRFSKRRFVEVKYRERKPETIKEAFTNWLSMELLVDGKYIAQSTPDLREKALTDFISKAIENARLLEEDPFRTLPDPSYYEGRTEKDLDIVDPNYKSYSPQDRHQMVQSIEDACLKEGGEKVISVTANVYDHFYEEEIMNSKGFTGSVEATECWTSANMTLQDEGDRRPNGYFSAGVRKLDDMLSPEFIGIETARRTKDLIGGKKIKSENLPVIIENRTTSRVLGGFIGAMYGRNVQQNSSFLIDKKGKQIGSRHFSLIDDPLLKKGLRSCLYDGDGFPAKYREMISNGVLNDYYIDWYYSRKLGVDPTTGGPTNLIIPPGEKSTTEIMKELGRGIYITGFIGGNSNSTTGDFSVGIIGHLFENGVPVQPIAEMNIADNHLQFWNKLIATANDPWIYGGWRIPSLVFEDVMVSGI